MGRAERRRAEREAKKKRTATYNMTKAQLHNAVKDTLSEDLERVRQEAYNQAVNDAMILMLTLPLEVLMDYYWQKSYSTRIPKFVERVLEYYSMWQNDELDMEKLKQDLWEYGGVKLCNEDEVKEEK